MLRTLRTSLLFLLPGLAVASVWIMLTGGSIYWKSLRNARFIYLIPLFTITLFCIFLRFIRWQFLLRRAGIRIPTRPSFSVFLASFLGVLTPAYIGEIIRSILLRKKFRVSLRAPTVLLVLEKLLDAVSLALIGLAAAKAWDYRAVMVLVIGLAFLSALGLKRFAWFVRISPKAIFSASRPLVLIHALVLSIAGWLPTCLLFRLAAEGVGMWLPLWKSASIFVSSTLLGGLSLLPAGVIVTGSSAIYQLQEIGFALTSAVLVVSLVRLSTIGLTLVMGGIFMFRELRNIQMETSPHAPEHFDEISDRYEEEFPIHIWNHLLERRLDLLAKALPRPNSGLGLDVGCGIGQICRSMTDMGYRVIGIDPSQKLLGRARAAGVAAVNGSALSLPFANGTFEFVYIVGAFHHFGDKKLQLNAFKEVQRVLKSDGYLVVHETNPQNPFFRFYMGYMFPLMRSIDEGNEWWIEPDRWETFQGMKLIQFKYFTFLPDFIPPVLMKPFLGIQRWLEETRLRMYSAHYMVVMQKLAGSIN